MPNEFVGYTQDPPDHWIIAHMAKTAGTSLRRHVLDFVREANLSVQTAYGENDAAIAEQFGRLFRVERFTPARPARIIMGHLVWHDIFRQSLRYWVKVRYIMTLREPVAWLVSLYGELARVEHRRKRGVSPTEARSLKMPVPNAQEISKWAAQEVSKCPCLVRRSRGDPNARFRSQKKDDGQSSSGCDDSQLSYWLSPKQSVSSQCSRPSSCEDAVAALHDSISLVLLSERFGESLALLRRELNLPETATIQKVENAHRMPAEHHRNSHAALRSLVNSTCLPEIYRRAQERFEDTTAKRRQSHETARGNGRTGLRGGGRARGAPGAARLRVEHGRETVG
jgi:hypothetical protein